METPNAPYADVLEHRCLRLMLCAGSASVRDVVVDAITGKASTSNRPQEAVPLQPSYRQEIGRYVCLVDFAQYVVNITVSESDVDQGRACNADSSEDLSGIFLDLPGLPVVVKVGMSL